MAALTVVQPSLTGAVATPVAASAGGDTFANDGKVYLRVKNAHATLPRTVTVDAPGTCDFGAAAHAAHDSVRVVAALTEVEIGPFPVDQFSATGAVSYSDSAADLSVSAVRKAN